MRKEMTRSKINRNDIICQAKLSKIVRKDILEILEIENLSFNDAWSKEMLETEIKFNDSINLKLRKSNKLIAYLFTRDFIDSFHILNIAVHPNYRKMGFAKKLLEELIKKVSKPIILEVRTTNKAAINLYKKFNFKKIYTRKKYYDFKVDAIVMLRENKKG
jgi:[ribosomal protein S18]-alanine N-acetyltransferase